MQIKFNQKFLDELNEIRNFIALDSLDRAENFVQNIKEKCLNLKILPNANRPNKVVLKPNARDLIVDGYVIPYVIFDETIFVLGIFKQNEWQI